MIDCPAYTEYGVRFMYRYGVLYYYPGVRRHPWSTAGGPWRAGATPARASRSPGQPQNERLKHLDSLGLGNGSNGKREHGGPSAPECGSKAD